MEGERLITAPAHDLFFNFALAVGAAKTGDPKTAVEQILRRITRYELFWNIDLEGPRAMEMDQRNRGSKLG